MSWYLIIGEGVKGQGQTARHRAMRTVFIQGGLPFAGLCPEVTRILQVDWGRAVSRTGEIYRGSGRVPAIWPVC